MTPPPQSPLAALDRMVEALEALSDRHRWHADMGECICSQHKEAVAALQEAPALRERIEQLLQKMQIPKAELIARQTAFDRWWPNARKDDDPLWPPELVKEAFKAGWAIGISGAEGEPSEEVVTAVARAIRDAMWWKDIIMCTPGEDLARAAITAYRAAMGGESGKQGKGKDNG